MASSLLVSRLANEISSILTGKRPCGGRWLYSRHTRAPLGLQGLSGPRPPGRQRRRRRRPRRQQPPLRSPNARSAATITQVRDSELHPSPARRENRLGASPSRSGLFLSLTVWARPPTSARCCACALAPRGGWAWARALAQFAGLGALLVCASQWRQLAFLPVSFSLSRFIKCYRRCYGILFRALNVH
jgi:hypothetical protein|uniref:Uncharacterized protein n=1 Tax=Mus musculus TaxID=10090 RepID=Q3UPT2_MOUSE|nr:unnamed protein product [Mus musculus]